MSLSVFQTSNSAFRRVFPVAGVFDSFSVLLQIFLELGDFVVLIGCSKCFDCILN